MMLPELSPIFDSDKTYDTEEEAKAAVDTYYNDPNRWTDKGWPRPRSPYFGGLPVPWVSPIDELKRVHPGRMEEIITHGRCQVCGNGFYEPDTPAYLMVNEDEVPEDLSSKNLQAMDNAVLHATCFRLAYGRCPALLALRGAGTLKVFVCEHRYIQIFEPPDEGRYLGVDGQHVTHVTTLFASQPQTKKRE